MVEQPAVNRRVTGSSPVSGAIFLAMYWLYLLENPASRFYIGQTEDVLARLEDHNRTDKMAGNFTRKNGPWRLVRSEAHLTRAAALPLETQIKSVKSADEFANSCSMAESRWIRINGRATGSPDESG